MTRLGKFNISHIGSLSAMLAKLLRNIAASKINTFGFLSRSSFLALIIFCGTFLCTAFPAEAIEVLFVTRTAAPTTDASEQARINKILTWPGFTVQQISSQDTQVNYNAAVQSADVVYLSERVNSNTLNFDTAGTCTGIVFEESALVDNLGIADGTRNYTSEQIYVSDLGHYITQTFAGIGTYNIFSPQQSLQYLYTIASVAPGASVLAIRPTNTDEPALVTVDTGDLLNDASTAASRRVFLPWMRSPSTATDFNSITADGETLMRRSLEWASMDNRCFALTKRAFLADGTPVTNGAVLAKGTEVRFLIYANNFGPARNDISVQDILDVGFGYQSPSLKTATMAACATQSCSAAQEQTIYNTVNATGVKTDAIDLTDEVSYSIGTTTVDAGNQNVANQQLDIPANTLWALLLTVRVK